MSVTSVSERAPAPTGPRRVTAADFRSPLPVVPWSDPVIDTVGHDPRSTYMERFWLSALGPSTLLLLRRLADRFDEAPDGFTIDLQEISSAIGLGGKTNLDSPLLRALVRTCVFGMARLDASGTLAVRRACPPLARRQLERLPASLREEHASWVDRHSRRPKADELRLRARHLALSLFELGEGLDEAERQLHQWRFHPALAHDAVRWAWAEYQARMTPLLDAGAAPAAPA